MEAKRKKKRSKLILLLVIAVLAAAGIFAVRHFSEKAEQARLPLSDTLTLSRGPLRYTISAAGTVESADEHYVYSTLAYPVMEICAKVGDSVSPGDVLIKLDPSDLKDQIAVNELSLDVSGDSTSQQVKAAQDSYNAAKQQREAGTGILSAQQQVDSAAKAFEDALQKYNEVGGDELKAAVENAETAYTNAQRQLEATEKSLDAQVENAKNALSSAKIAAGGEVSELQLQQMYETLEKTELKAPAAGTVTAIYAKVGASGAGLMAMIEDTESLLVKTSVKGYDVSTVREGMRVLIRADAADAPELSGVIESIAPTSDKTSAGAAAAGDPTFSATVRVETPQSGLRIGESVRLDYIVEEAEDVIAVPYDSIYENASGQSCVLLLEESENGAYLLTEAPVETGMENDLYTAVTGSGITEGARIVSRPENYTAGSVMFLYDGKEESAVRLPFMPGAD